MRREQRESGRGAWILFNRAKRWKEGVERERVRVRERGTRETPGLANRVLEDVEQSSDTATEFRERGKRSLSSDAG